MSKNNGNSDLHKSVWGVQLQVAGEQLQKVLNLISPDVKLTRLVPEESGEERNLSEVTSADIAREVITACGGKVTVDQLRKEFSKRGFPMSTVKPALTALEKAGEVQHPTKNEYRLAS